MIDGPFGPVVGATGRVVTDHEAHDQAERVLSRSRTTIAHVAVETYGVLTRLPVPLRVGAASAAEIVDARLASTWLALDAAGHASAIAALGAARVGAGATYDGLIALTALAHGVLLVSRDRGEPARREAHAATGSSAQRLRAYI